jgi:ADP-ribosylglycohydrolase
MLNYPSSEQRVLGAILGQFIGDALALGTHWYYDLHLRETDFPHTIQGFETPQPGRYHASKESGQQTHYGDRAWLLLEYIATERNFDVRTFGQRCVDHLSADYSGYIDPVTHHMLSRYNLARKMGMKAEAYSFQEGGNDDHAMTAAILAPLAVLWGSEQHYSGAIIKLTKLMQNNAKAIAYTLCYARILASILEGATPREAVVTQLHNQSSCTDSHQRETSLSLMQVLGAIDLMPLTATLIIGQTGALSSSLPATLHTVLHHSDCFETALLSVIRAGGDNAARAGMAGALLGAHLGIEAIPVAWLERLEDHDKLLECAKKLTLHPSYV